MLYEYFDIESQDDDLMVYKYKNIFGDGVLDKTW